MVQTYDNTKRGLSCLNYNDSNNNMNAANTIIKSLQFNEGM